jgi:phage tail-like protein
MSNLLFDPLVSYNFFVTIDGITVAQFKECDGLSMTIKVIEHREQMLSSPNLGVPLARKMPGSVSFEDITLRRGKIADQSFWKWIRDVQKGGIASARKTGSIIVYDWTGVAATTFQFRDGWPSMVEVGKLQAGSDSVLLETVRITHEELTVVGA